MIGDVIVRMTGVSCCCTPGRAIAAKVPSDEDAKRLAGLLKAVSDPARVRIIFALTGGELCVCEIMALLHMPQTMVSHHCKILKYAGIVTDRRSGKWVHYSLADPRLPGLLETLYQEG